MIPLSSIRKEQKQENLINIDLNCDLGQSFGVYKNDQELELLQYVSSVNISCGSHAGDPVTIMNMLKLASENNLSVGAHIGYPDIQGFGYRNMSLNEEEIVFAPYDALQLKDILMERAKIAFEMFAYRVKKYIGAYSAAMGGVDLILFTGGIGENGCEMRSLVCSDLKYLGVDFDIEKNRGKRGVDLELTKPTSKTKVMVVTTNEELVIARDTQRIVGNI